MRCPVCKLENPSDAMICDCGYNFFTQIGGNVIKKSLNPVVKGLLIGLLINSIIILLFLFSLEWDFDNLSIDKPNALILIIGFWQWIYILPINILLLKSKKGFATGINISAFVLLILNFALILWMLHDISFLPTFVQLT